MKGIRQRNGSDCCIAAIANATGTLTMHRGNEMNATYLPAETEVVIAREGRNEWYTSRMEVEVGDYHVAICPLRGVSVLTAEVRGYRVWFMQSQLQVRLNTDQNVRAENLDLVKLEYDIPTEVSRSGRIPHPSQWMWVIGVRTTKSCWILPRKSIPYNRLREMMRFGCQYEVTRIHPSEAASKLQQAMIALRIELEEGQQRYEASMTAALTRFDERGRQTIESVNRYNADITRNEKALEKVRQNVADGCKALGIDQNWLTSSSLRAVAKAQRAVLDRRIIGHATITQRLAEAGHTAAAREIENGMLPHDIAADYAEDHNVSEVIADENGEYSLRDVFKD